MAERAVPVADVARRAPRLGAVLRALRASIPFTTGLVMTLAVIVLSLIAPLMVVHDPLKLDLAHAFQAPSPTYLLGTDDLGRDILTRLLLGGRVALLIAALAVAWSSIVGIALGLVAGYLGGWVDALLMRVMDAQLAIPGLLLALGITAALGPSLPTLAVAIGVAGIPGFARLIRSQVLVLRELEYVTAARVIGAPSSRIMLRHVLPGTTSNVIVSLSLRAPSAIVAEASLSFLGLGVQPPTPTWGSMINTGQRYLEIAPMFTFAPAAAILLTVLSLTLLGEGIRDLLDPRVRARVGLR